MYHERFAISSHDVDPAGTLQPANLLRIMQETANHQMRDERPSYMELFDMGKAFLLSRMAVEVYAPLHQYEAVDSYTWPAAGRGATHYRCSCIQRGGEVVARGFGHWALVDTQTRRLLRVGEVPMHYSDGPLVELPGVRFQMPEALSEVGRHVVLYHEIDVNRHLNNTRYMDLLVDFLPERESHWVTGFSLHFLSEAPLGEELTVFCSDAQPEEGGGLRRFFRTVRRDGRVNLEATVRLTPRDPAAR